MKKRKISLAKKMKQYNSMSGKYELSTIYHQLSTNDAGGNNGGKSHISYKPYGEIHRTDSSGPDITRFKFTGQEEDKESSLLHYKARYYDPMVGRFLQADSMAFPDRIMGMNRYMYTEGSPVNYRDPSGHRQTRGFFGGLVHDFNKGSKNMAHDFNKATGQEKHQGKNAFARSDIGRSEIGNYYRLWEGFYKAFKYKPLEAIRDYAYAWLDFEISSFMNPIMGDPRPSIRAENGAVVVRNSFNANHGIFGAADPNVSASTSGSYVSLRSGASQLTYNHEMIHVRQWWSGSLSKFPGGKIGDPSEHGADFFSGTNSYLTWTILYTQGLISKESYKQILQLNSIDALSNQSYLEALLWNLIGGYVK